MSVTIGEAIVLVRERPTDGSSILYRFEMEITIPTLEALWAVCFTAEELQSDEMVGARLHQLSYGLSDVLDMAREYRDGNTNII